MNRRRNKLRKGTQLSFNSNAFDRPGDVFGGSLLKNSNAKTKRPLDSKFPLHLVLRSDVGKMRSLKVFGAINKSISEISRKHGIKIYKFANVGNHLHLLIKIRHVRGWAAYIRELTGRIAQVAQGISGREKGVKFWSQRPFTRIVRGWKRAFEIAKDYVHLNLLESEGLISRKETRTLRDLRSCGIKPSALRLFVGLS